MQREAEEKQRIAKMTPEELEFHNKYGVFRVNTKQITKEASMARPES